MTTYIEDIKLCKKKYGGLNRLKTVRDILQKYVDQDNKDVILYLIFRHNFFRHYGNPGYKKNIPLEKNFKLKVIYQIYKYSAKYLSLQTANELKRYQDFNIELNNNSNEKTKIRDKYKDIKNLIKVKKLLLNLKPEFDKTFLSDDLFSLREKGIFIDTKEDYESKLKNNNLNLDEQLYYKYRLNRIYRILNIDFQFETPFKSNFKKINDYIDSLIYKSKITLNNYRILYLNNIDKEDRKSGFTTYQQGVGKIKINSKIINKRIKNLEKKVKTLKQKLKDLNINNNFSNLDFRLLKQDKDFILSKKINKNLSYNKYIINIFEFIFNQIYKIGESVDDNIKDKILKFQLLDNKSVNQYNDFYLLIRDELEPELSTLTDSDDRILIPSQLFAILANSIFFTNNNIKDDKFQQEALKLKNEYNMIEKKGQSILNKINNTTTFTDNKKTPKIDRNDKIKLLIGNLQIKTMSENPILIFEDDIQKIFKDNKNILNEINSRSAIVNNQEPSNLLNNLVPTAIGLFALYKKFKK